MKARLDPVTMLADVMAGLETEDREVCSIYGRETKTPESVRSRDFARMIRAWAGLVRKHQEDIIPVFGRMTPNMLAAYFGVMVAGKRPAFISYPSVKINPADYQKKLENYTKQLASAVFIGESCDAGIVENLLTPDSLSGDADQGPIRTLDPAEPLFLQCSSGSTGLQKSVAITSGLLGAQLDHYGDALKLCESDVIVSWLPLYHDMGLIATCLLPLFKKIPVVFIDPFDWVVRPSLLLKAIQEHRGTLCWQPNFAFSFMTKAKPDFDLATMRLFINCAEPVTAPALEAFSLRFSIPMEKLGVSYALAENVFAVTQTALGAPPTSIVLDTDAYCRNIVHIASGDGKRVVSCGPVIDGVQVRIDSQPGEDIGEVLIAGECAVPGYFRLPDNREHGWLRTGDLGFLREGELYICGRKKALIITNGKNIYPQDVEEVANEFDDVYDGRVVALGLQEAGEPSEQVLTLFEPARKFTLKERDVLCAGIKRRIDLLFDISSKVVMVPRTWLAKTSSGKIARGANLQKYLKYRNRHFYIVGDSHVRCLWSGFSSYRDTLENVHVRWFGILKSLSIHLFHKQFEKVLSEMTPVDMLVISLGEPEIRSIIPGAVQPMQTLKAIVSTYEAYFQALKARCVGELGYMTGPPTNSVDVGQDQFFPSKALESVPTVGTPEKRYHFQRKFHEEMKAMCGRVGIPFIDSCSEILGEHTYLPAEYVKDDGVHMNGDQKWKVFMALENACGFVSSQERDYGADDKIWLEGPRDFRENFFVKVKQMIQGITPIRGQEDFSNLLESGTIDSLGIIELIQFLEEDFKVPVDIGNIDIRDFKSIETIFNRYVLRQSEALPGLIKSAMAPSPPSREFFPVPH